ncbi:MAG TPA: aminotransferase class I/II-fold pyridoxal phosphate-dependent enzyme [Aggregatilinea sp.]|uniref:pyridoxal phosphate-dependent aminotransferase n=1 Tax=Aggregatilinea sp. TaxID=2806333 RepID=UPI002C9242E1|nr:aminotransferase class I/II-fold pyridoxal phosphate-dependent enzyme [Aggregatilinea sp.]HML21322.1 aminotransferase class I/II-fold pyridoxal phosphate-dependent enzyme [Aggregatilinea sp.]
MRQFIADRVLSVPPSGIRRFFDISATMDDVISLGIGEPDFVTPAPIVRAGIASLQAGDTHYTSNSGTVELRQAISDYLKRLYGIEYNPANEILVTVGVSEALYLIMTALLNPGDEVIVPQPCFTAYTAEVMFATGVPVIIDTSPARDFQVTAAEIEAAITPRTKAILIGYPNNPTGAIMSREALAEIAAVAEKHDLIVISDEIYDRLIYSGFEHTHFATLDHMRERTIVLGGFSKSHAMTGWRLGYAVGPAWLIDPMRKIHQYTIMSAPTTAQIAVAEMLPNAEDAVEEMRVEYDRRRKLIVSGFNSLGLTCFEPRGAFYAFPNIAAAGMDENEFAETLLMEEKVAVVPGSAFGASGAGFVRACYATSYDKIEEALERIHRFMERHG